MSIKLLSNRILVKRCEKKEASILVIPDNAKEQLNEGVVCVVGVGKRENGKLVKPNVKVGDKVFFSHYTGSEITLKGEVYLTMKEDDIYGVLENE